MMMRACGRAGVACLLAGLLACLLGCWLAWLAGLLLAGGWFEGLARRSKQKRWRNGWRRPGIPTQLGDTWGSPDEACQDGLICQVLAAANDSACGQRLNRDFWPWCPPAIAGLVSPHCTLAVCSAVCRLTTGPLDRRDPLPVRRLACYRACGLFVDVLCATCRRPPHAHHHLEQHETGLGCAAHLDLGLARCGQQRDDDRRATAPPVLPGGAHHSQPEGVMQRSRGRDGHHMGGHETENGRAGHIRAHQGMTRKMHPAYCGSCSVRSAITSQPQKARRPCRFWTRRLERAVLCSGSHSVHPSPVSTLIIIALVASTHSVDSRSAVDR
jgi:hypothetical protein